MGPRFKFITLLALYAGQVAFADRKAVPFLCDNLLKILSPDVVQQIASEDNDRREREAMHLLGLDGLQQIQQAVGVPPFQKIQTLKEALSLLDRVATEKSVYDPINQVLNRLTGPRRWALYLLTGFHAVSTHSDDHRSMIQQSVNALPKSAVRGGSSPRFVDYGIGNANLMAAGIANNPQAIFTGVDVAGGSLNRSMQALNEIADQLQTAHPGPRMFDYGRFGLVRGSGSDPQLLKRQRFDGASWVLTLFALPKAEREKALRLSANRLEPGGALVLIDPTPAIYGPEGKTFLPALVTSAFKNNPDLTVLDVAILTAMNAHGLFKKEFMTGEEQRALGEKVGLIPKGEPTPVYFGIASHQAFEKPWKMKSRGKRVFNQAGRSTPSRASAFSKLKERVNDELARLSPEPLSLELANNSHREEVKTFIQEQRESLGVHIADALDKDLADLEVAFQSKGGFLFALKDTNRKMVGTFAFSPLNEKTAEIKKLYLAEPFRQLGFGSKILDGLIEFLAETGYSRVYAETSPLLQSDALFSQAGFRRTRKPTGATQLMPKRETYWLMKPLPQPIP